MRTYETVVILHPDLIGDELTAQIDKLKGYLEGEQAEILNIDNWGSRKLAYLVRKQPRGTFVLYIYQAPAAAIAEFERRLRIEDSVLKFQTVQLEKGYQAPAEPVAEESEEETASPVAETETAEGEATA
ncbi:30S ribosomal protein S6 [Geothermobacter hydrogeniphilus]|uniref:Small ribosomal subunit protein bS6 n=1 Tax=Geothermobacter hydrogeniphilus TaxID=1969733 RepID=A0A1X0YDG3_9BACT|nr:30S ribosomal protein S6 [Geothermobacter hydrogeniphilus]ORJ63024.1 30S ribosomal protein S6 [Geothermobacter hydrogeniphilus]